ncbi:hypothetical protein EDB87DRAFT_1582036 [Lactarius vividus]|nr:hypothetical protein EDB87DRAFT_1582036 [Lactarius vividus]
MYLRGNPVHKVDNCIQGHSVIRESSSGVLIPEKNKDQTHSDVVLPEVDLWIQGLTVKRKGYTRPLKGGRHVFDMKHLNARYRGPSEHGRVRTSNTQTEALSLTLLGDSGSGALRETAPFMMDTISHCIFLSFPDRCPRWRSRISYKKRKRNEFRVGASKAEEKRRLLGCVHALVRHKGAQWFFDSPTENVPCTVVIWVRSESVNGSNQGESNGSPTGHLHRQRCIAYQEVQLRNHEDLTKCSLVEDEDHEGLHVRGEVAASGLQRISDAAATDSKSLQIKCHKRTNKGTARIEFDASGTDSSCICSASIMGFSMLEV